MKDIRTLAIIILAAVSLTVFLTGVIFALIHYFAQTRKSIYPDEKYDDSKKEKQCRRWKVWKAVSYRIMVRLCSIDTLIVITLLAAIYLVIHTTCCNLHEKDLTIITISFTFAAIIPYIISKSIAKSEIEKIIDERFDGRFNNIASKYNTSIFALRKSTAHSRRITAELLSKQPGKSNEEWALGWAAEGIISYILIRETYDKSMKYARECGEIIKKEFEKINKAEDTGKTRNNGVPENTDDNPEDKDRHRRTLRSILTMHSLMNTLELNQFGGIGEETLKQVEDYFIKDMDDEIKRQLAASCKVSDLFDEVLNNAITENAKKHMENLINKGVLPKE